MLKSRMVAGIALGAALLVTASAAIAQDATRRIIVTGEGVVLAAPDMATVGLGVIHEDREAKAAMDRVSDDVRAMVRRLESFGVQPRDVQTTTLRLDPIWRDRSRSTPREAPRVDGFVARNDLSIRLREMPRLGEVLDSLLGEGANQFSNVTFGVKNPEPLILEARQRAVADARSRAELYAQAAGVRLGPVLQIQEPSGAVPTPNFARAEMLVSESGMPLAGGELSFSAKITVVYAIAP